MTARLASSILVTALLRKVGQRGGFGTVIWRGDPDAGGILATCFDRGTVGPLLEFGHDHEGLPAWRRVGPDAATGRDAYLESRRRLDRDLWLIELDIPDAARFAAETISVG